MDIVVHDGIPVNDGVFDGIDIDDVIHDSISVNNVVDDAVPMDEVVYEGIAMGGVVDDNRGECSIRDISGVMLDAGGKPTAVLNAG